ncbi:ethanolamine utilization protein EutN [Thermoanaerobacteraceae bacterium SP2]|nr:ethanolamine utilization protein EutN [Thermoanaerobacteraceae bacterium SP2]
MKLAKVVGSCVSTIKQSELKGFKMLLVQDFSAIEKKAFGTPFIAVDTVGAGDGEIVCVVQGTPAQRLLGPQNLPVDAAIVAIVDSFSLAKQEED